MVRSSNVTSAQIERLMKAFAALGRPIINARLFPDGSVLLLSGKDDQDCSDVDGSWVDLAGLKAPAHAPHYHS